MLDLRLGNSLSERILPMPKSPFLSPFLATEVEDEEAVEAVGPPPGALQPTDDKAKGVEGPTQSSSTLCTYFL